MQHFYLMQYKKPYFVVVGDSARSNSGINFPFPPFIKRPVPLPGKFCVLVQTLLLHHPQTI